MRPTLALWLGVPLGLVFGVGTYTFVYARGASYPTNDPAACAKLKARVDTIQTRTFELRNVAMDAVLGLIGDLEKARDGGAADAALAERRRLQREAQFLLDFIEAENSMGFHAPAAARPAS